MIAFDHRYASKISASALGFGLLVSGIAADAAGKTSTAVPAAPGISSPAGASASADGAAPHLTIAFDDAGVVRDVATSAATVGEFLAANGIHPVDGDFLSRAAGDALADGMRLAYRPAVSIVFHDGTRTRTIRTSDSTVADLLAGQHLMLASNDEVRPALDTPLADGSVVRVTHVSAWTKSERTKIAPRVQKRFDARLARGTKKTIAPGIAGIRETKVTFVARDGRDATKTVVSSRVVRSAKPQVVVVGTGPASALRTFAQERFSGAVRFAGEAFHVLATAYTGSCYGCSGFTASGARAGHGIIAVDPRVIPLGTRLFIPGYGRAVAGDTGGAIVGHRVDLGFDGLADAREFGRRAIVMYVVH